MRRDDKRGAEQDHADGGVRLHGDTGVVPVHQPRDRERPPDLRQDADPDSGDPGGDWNPIDPHSPGVWAIHKRIRILQSLYP